MPNDLIRYDLLVQEALCGVVKKVLGDVARTRELPGDHHFYVTFRTHAPGVRLSSRMREQYPEEMTIILQHQFEDLKVTDQTFEVRLSFKGVEEKLVVPFDALTGFFDPSVPFNFKFEPQPDAEEAPGEPAPAPGPRALPTLAPPPAQPAPPLAAVPKTGTEATGGTKPQSEQETGEAAKVVSIDAFRKKP